jgi:hypothetical protein
MPYKRHKVREKLQECRQNRFRSLQQNIDAVHIDVSMWAQSALM